LRNFLRIKAMSLHPENGRNEQRCPEVKPSAEIAE
jgi:hypothetical protein